MTGWWYYVEHNGLRGSSWSGSLERAMFDAMAEYRRMTAPVARAA